MKKVIVVLCLALFGLLALPGTASGLTLAQQVAALQRAVTALRTVNTQQNAKIASLTSQLTTAKATIASQGQTLSTLTTQLAAVQQTDAGLRADLNGVLGNPVLELGQYVSVVPDTLYDERVNMNVAGPSIVFTGANLFMGWSNGSRECVGFGAPAGLASYLYQSLDYYGPGHTDVLNQARLPVESPWLTGIKFYRSESPSGPWTEMADIACTMATNGADWKDEYVPTARTLYYGVRAHDAQGHLGPMTVASVAIAP